MLTLSDWLVACGFVLTSFVVALCMGCETEPQSIVLHPEPTAISTPDGCPESSVGTDGECREKASGRVTIPECCGRVQ